VHAVSRATNSVSSATRAIRDLGGAMAAMTMVEYGSARNSIIRKAAAPMMGGVIWPPVDAAASTPPAKWRG